MMKMARVILEVHAGVLPGVPMEEYGKRWVLSREEWDADADLVITEALEYAKSLIDPAYVNWVRYEWIWL